MSYPNCTIHAAEAALVYCRLEQFRRVVLAELSLETTVGELFEAPGVLDSRPPTLEPLVAAKLLELAALEQGMPLGDSAATRALWSRHVPHDLLGNAGQHCKWDPATIWSRSIRGIINERV